MNIPVSRTKYMIRTRTANGMHPAGLVAPSIVGAEWGELWCPCDGAWHRVSEKPELFAVIGHSYDCLPDNESRFKKLVRRLLHLPGPWEHMPKDLFRVPDFNGRRLL